MAKINYRPFNEFKIIVSPQDCFSIEGDSRPLYRLPKFDDPTNTSMLYMTRGNTYKAQQYDNEPTIEFFQEYTNVSGTLRLYVYFYLVMTSLCIFVSIINYRLKIRNWVWTILQKTEEISPTILALFCILFVRFRFTYEARICLCDFREDFFLVRNGWAWTNPNYKNMYSAGDENSQGDYRCNNNLDVWLYIMLIYEAIITGLHFLSILYYYFTNVFKVSFKKQVE